VEVLFAIAEEGWGAEHQVTSTPSNCRTRRPKQGRGVAHQVPSGSQGLRRNCDCGQAVANVADLAQADEPPQLMTGRQALRCWPGAAGAIVAHAVACAWQLAEAGG
jgi:hypothetical protein